MRTAVVLDCPSIDPAPGQLLSEWEWSVTKELMDAAGLQPEVVLAASSTHFKKWPDCFAGKPGASELLPAFYADRQKLIADLTGFDMALTMGSHAMFCLTGETKIDTYRGTHIDSIHLPGLQVVPTYSPTLFARTAWTERPVVFSAMKKALHRYEDIDRQIFIPETPADLDIFTRDHIRNSIVFDVETNGASRITEFSLATDSRTCLYIQLEDRGHNSYWSAEDELAIFAWLASIARRRDLSWGFHHAAYDLSYLDAYGIRPAGPIFDTMLRYHAYQPEWEKSLGFLASLHVPTRAWKHLRTQAKKNFNKAGAI